KARNLCAFAADGLPATGCAPWRQSLDLAAPAGLRREQHRRPPWPGARVHVTSRKVGVPSLPSAEEVRLPDCLPLRRSIDAKKGRMRREWDPGDLIACGGLRDRYWALVVN